MKRSEMLSYMTDELMEILEAANTRNERENVLSFAQRKAAGMLDMLLGFGMLPPATITPLTGGYGINDCTHVMMVEGKMVSAESRNVWEPEDEA